MKKFKMLVENIPSTFIECFERPLLFRGSALPFCGLRYLISHYDKVKSHFTGLTSWYFTIGTMIHEYVQQWLGINGVMYGKWLCTQCGKEHEGKFKICSCGSIPKYKEYTIAYAGFAGSCDGIIKIGKKWYILEIKSIAKHKMNKLTAPIYQHKLQASAYWLSANKTLFEGISGIIIMYVSREDFFKGKIVTKLFKVKPDKEFTNTFFDWVEVFKLANKVKKDLHKFEPCKLRLCKNFFDYGNKFKDYYQCPYAKICFNDKEIKRYYKTIKAA